MRKAVDFGPLRQRVRTRETKNVTMSPFRPKARTLTRFIGAVAVLYFGLASAIAATEVYVQTEVDSNGQLHILTKRHREIVPKREPEQVGVERVVISPDGRAVGWLALYPNGSPSDPDPVPLKLVVYANDGLRTFTGRGLPIWRWRFQADGKEVAFEQETVHGGTGVHYELRDITTGDLVAAYDPDSSSDIIAKPPRWVAEVGSKQ